MKRTMTTEQFKARLGSFVSSIKESWKIATELAVEAILAYRVDGETQPIVDLHEAFAYQASDEFRSSFEKLVWATTNLHFKQDMEDLSKPVEVVPQKDQEPKAFVEKLEQVKKEGLRAVYGNKPKTKRSAVRLNRNGAPAVRSVEGAKSAKTTELNEEQKALKAKLDAAYEQQVKNILDGKPVSLAGEGVDIPFQGEARQIFEEILEAAKQVPEDEILGILKHAKSQIDAKVKKALAKLAAA